MPASLNEGLTAALGGGGVLTLLGLGLRFLMKSIRAEKSESAANNAETGGYARQQKEIEYLGRKIEELQAQVDTLQDGNTLRREYDLAIAGDLAVLNMLTEELSEHTGDDLQITIVKIQVLVQRLITRSYKVKE